MFFSAFKTPHMAPLSDAISRRDVDAMASLFSDDADFGHAGSGPAALRRLMEATMADLQFGVILVANHTIGFDSETSAHGEVWARCFAQTEREGYYEQVIKYVDRYVCDAQEVLMPVRGHWRLEWDGGSAVLNPGDTCLIPAGLSHGLSPSVTGEASLYRVRSTEDPAGPTANL